MTSLSDFGGGIEDAEMQTTPSRSTVYPHGRCEAVIGDGHHIRRCQNGAKRGRNCCHQHVDRKNQLTIHSSATDLVRLGGPRSGSCHGIQGNGHRCSNSTTATEILCGIHQDSDEIELVEPTDSELDQVRLKAALNALSSATV